MSLALALALVLVAASCATAPVTPAEPLDCSDRVPTQADKDRMVLETRDGVVGVWNPDPVQRWWICTSTCCTRCQAALARCPGGVPWWAVGLAVAAGVAAGAAGMAVAVPR